MTPKNEITKTATTVSSPVGQLVQNVGLVKVTMGAAVYAAHIRQMDRRAHSGQRRLPLKTAIKDLYE